MNGTFWSIIPAYVQRLDLGPGAVASFMTFAIIGSALSPYPVGRLSDRFDRRKVIVGMSLAVMVPEIAMALIPAPQPFLLYTLGFLVGGLITVLYPLMTALSVDRLGPDKAVPVASTTLFIYCLGAIVGPTFVAWLMSILGDRMLFVHNALVHFAIIAYALWRISREGPIPHGNKSPVDTGEERLVG